MPTLTLEYTTDAERLGIEQALAFFRQLQQVAATAPDGSVLAACEQVALTDGRQLLRDTLATVVQMRADATDEKKGPVPAAGRSAPKGDTAGRCGPRSVRSRSAAGT